ncbi:MAG: RsmB/NOP family class I SAM-dependent RNA methyltransferase [Atopobiaceae bacterium]|nr:hypothetical protein [Olegusella sp.]MCI1934657.1 hypothetical protein [Atopobiaceae bacterium]
MFRGSPARRAALDLISRRRRRGAHMRELLRSSSMLDRLGPRDRALAVRIALGVTSTSGTLDVLINAHLHHGAHLEPRVRDAMRISCYEICWLQTPDAVAVAEGVELVRSVAPRAAGLANAVLRHISADDAPRVADACHRLALGDPNLLAKDIALAAGFPEWLSYQLLCSCGAEVCQQTALAQLEPAPVFVAVNTALLCERESVRRMAEAGLDPCPLPFPGAWRINAAGRLASSGLVDNAVVLPCDLAAQMVARIAAPVPGRRMLEVGQGRGTKTALFELVALEAGGFAELTSIDSEGFKVRVASSRMAKAGVSGHVNSLVFDGRDLARQNLPPALAGGFDTVFVDAPCSGTGTMRRHPEIVWGLERKSVSPTRTDSLPTLQLRLLRAASARVRPGGALLYATCSLLAQEDEDIIEAFLVSDEGEGFEVSSVLEAPGVSTLPKAAYELLAANVSSEGFFCSHPTADSFDGHFCARLVRTR